eukprot:6574800-Pyramimonas_sp.AAC.1
MSRLPRPASLQRIETTPRAHPLWCRESATPAEPREPATRKERTPLRIPSGTDEVQRLSCLASVFVLVLCGV